MTDQLITYRGAVYPWHCDHMGHMNVMWYVGKFDEATWQVFSAVGLTPGFLRDNGRGLAALEQTINYKRELLAGDVVTIRSFVIEVKNKTIRFQHELTKSDTDEFAASSTLVSAYIDTKMRKACALPEFVSVQAAKLSIAGR